MARPVGFLALAALILALVLGGGYAGWRHFARQDASLASPASQGAIEESGSEKGVLAALIEKALSSPDMKVSVGAVKGALSSDATILDVTLSDARGVWLRLDRARLVWSRSSLLLGKLLVDRLDIDKLEILRKPLPSTPASAEDTPDAPAKNGGLRDLIPSLPVKLVVSAFSLGELRLGDDVIGVAARLAGKGHASLGRPSDGLDFGFDLQRLDAPGGVSLRLAFEPKSTALKIGAGAHEPAGGLIAHLAGLDGLPPVDFDLTGDGPLDSFKAKLNFDAGALASVAGGARLDRRGAERALTLDLAGRIASLLPPLLAPVFADETQLGGAALFGDDGGLGLDHFSIAAREARLDVDGRLGADNSLAGHVALRALGADGHAARSGEVEIGALELLADAAGALQTPKLDVRLHVADARSPAGRIGRLDAKFNADPNGPVTDPATRIDLSADASGDGLLLAESAFAEALGEHFSLTFRARAAPDGATDVALAKLDGATGKVEASGLFGPAQVKGKVSFDAPDLKHFSGLAGVALSGEASGQIDLDGAPRARLDARVALATDRLATGLPLADGLIGGKSQIAGGISKLRDGFAFDALTLNGPNLSAKIDGAASRAATDVAFSAEAPDLARVLPDLAGRASAQGRLTGALDHPDVAMTLALADVRSMGRAIPRLILDMTAHDILAAPDARIGIDGLVGGKTAAGAITLARGADGGWRFSAEALRIASVALSGSGALSPKRLVDGHFELEAGDLDDLSPLALQKLAGRLQAKLAFDATGGKQAANVVAKASGLRAAGGALDRLDLDMRVADLFGAPKIDGSAQIDRASFGGQTLSRLRANAISGADGSTFALSGEARGLALETKGRLAASAPLQVDLASFSARGQGQSIALAGPARLTFPPNAVEIAGLTLASGAGRLSVDGKAGERLDLTISGKALPLALARLAAPDLALSGALDIAAHLAGPASAPTGDWRLDVLKLSAPQLRDAGVGSSDIHGSGQLQGARTSLRIETSLPKGGSLRIEGSAPLNPTGALDLAIRGGLDLALANVALAQSGRRVGGKLSVDLRVQGAAANPQASGAANLDDGAFEDPLAGIKFNQINAVLRGRGDEILIERFNAATRGNGSVTLAGKLRLSPEAGFPASVRIDGSHAELVSNDIVTAVADLALTVDGKLASRPRVSGRIAFQSIDIRAPDRVPASSRPLEDAVHVAPTPAASARLALDKQKRRPPQGRKPPFDADLAIAISAPSRIFVRGHGIDAELGGDLTLRGGLARPIADGAFQLRRGTFSLAGQRLEFSRGAIGFAGDVVPELDFVAQSATSDVTAQIAISGPADQPVFTFSSTPELPQDEVISRLLFSSASGGLTPIQSLQLAQTVAELSGHGGPGVLEKMRRSLGVDTLDVQLGPDGSPRAGASRYITKNVNVGVRTGANPSDNAVTLGVDVTKRFRIQGEAGADGSATGGVAAQWEY